MISVDHADGRRRVRPRSARRLWRRLRALEAAVAVGRVRWPAARASVASWLGLAARADAFRLSRAIFAARDVRNVGKRLLVARLRHEPRAYVVLDVVRKALRVRIIDERPVGTVSPAVGRMADGIARVRRKRRLAP